MSACIALTTTNGEVQYHSLRELLDRAAKSSNLDAVVIAAVAESLIDQIREIVESNSPANAVTEIEDLIDNYMPAPTTLN